MISASNISLAYGKRVIFKDVNIKFTPGNCYGLIGANGAGKSTFLKILAGENETDKGEINVTSGERIAMLRQDQFAFDEQTVFNTVIMGHRRLYEVMIKREAIYAKADFNEDDGIRSGELEAEFAEMNGYEAETEAAVLLNGLGIPEELRHKKMKELEAGDKVRVLLAQALFGNPDILLLDEPTNHLDLESITALNNGLIDFPEVVLLSSHDHQFVNTVANRIIELTPSGIIDRVMNFEEYLDNPEITRMREQLHQGHAELSL
nr:ATP-binding cassette domain-containing protein [Geoalkalibacter subterraneus]